MSAAKTTFPLYGYERFHTLMPEASAKLAHVVTVRGDITTLVTHLPLAVVATFNQHPRMRVSLLPGTDGTKAMVGSPLVDVAELTETLYKLAWREKEEDSAEWMQFVEDACATPVNREQQWPYSVYVFADKTTQRFARIVVVADAYMADATSCALVANSVLANASMISQGQPLPLEQPMAQSLYECMHNVSPWLGVFSEAVSKWVLQPLFNFDHAGFTPVLPVDSETQLSYEGQPPARPNPSKAFFASGSPANMKAALERCQQEGVTLQGVTTAATLMAFGLAKHHGDLRLTPTITMKVDATFDKRGTDNHTVGAVGLYSLPGNLVFTASQGAAVTGHFWELARRCDHEWSVAREGHELKLQSMYVHETLTADKGQSGLHVNNCVLSDASVTTAGFDVHPHEITIGKTGGATSTLHIEAAHAYSALPSLSSACGMFVSGVTSFNYAMMAKLQSAEAQEVFHWFVEVMERLGDFTTADSLLTASSKLARLPPTTTASVRPLPVASV